MKAVLCLALGVMASAPAGAAASDVCAPLPPASLAFRFGTGARPVATPAVADDGGIYVGTSEGYLHALDARGGYRWGYTLKGPVTGRPIVGSSGAVLVPTRRRIYAIRPDGSLLWAFESPVPVLGDLIRDSLGRYNFASDDGRLFALSGQGALVAHVPTKGPPSVLPLAIAGAVAMAYESGGILLSRPGKNQRFELGGPARALLPCPGAELCAIVAGTLRSVGARRYDWQISATRAAGTAEVVAVVRDDRQLSLLAPGGDVRFTLELPEPVSATPVVTARGRVLVPLKSGALLVVSEGGEMVACTPVAASPLGTPVIDATRHRVLVTAVEGVLGAVDVE